VESSLGWPRGLQLKGRGVELMLLLVIISLIAAMILFPVFEPCARTPKKREKCDVGQAGADYFVLTCGARSIERCRIEEDELQIILTCVKAGD
jgi:hypothetical protein